MPDKFSYLKLSLTYFRGNVPATVFAFPVAEAAVRAPFNGEAISQSFINLTEFYVTGCHDGKRFYTFVNADESKQTTDRLELTLQVESDVLLAGRTVLNLFKTVKEMLDADAKFTDLTLTQALERAGFDEEPHRSAIAFAGNSLENKPCYRTYVSSTELQSILSFPRQNAYAPYSETVFVPATAVVNPGNAIPQITQPLQQTFSVVCPPGVEASSDNVDITDNLTLTYSCPGFDPTSVTFEVGTTNRYVRISGPALVVNTTEKAGITFSRRVAYKVVSSKGGLVKTYTILVNGRTATRADGIFDVSSTDFGNNGKVNISVSSTNYFTTSVDFTKQELFSHQPLELVLVPEQQTVVLRMEFGQGRTIEQQLVLEKASAEFRQLRAGSFHGFVCHRLLGGEPETYSVDMTAHSTASEIPNAATQISTKKEESKSAAQLRAERLRADIPVKEETTEKADTPNHNVNTRTETAGTHSDNPSKGKKRKMAYEKDIPKKMDILQDDPDEDEEQPRRMGKVPPMVLAAVTVFLVTVGIVWYLFTLLPKADDGNTSQDGVDITAADGAQRITVTDNIPDETVPAKEETQQIQATASAKADEKADVDYLNSNETWKLADLKSEKYRAFFNLLSDGNIEQIAQSDYFAVRDRATNRKAVKVMEYLWMASGTFAEKRNVKEMQSLKGKEEIDINALYESLSRMQDAKPNKAERPQRDE